MSQKPLKIRANYEPSVDEGVNCSGVGRTKQSFRDECDINNIMKNYEKNGLLPELIKGDPQYGDFANVPDYQESLDIVHKAHEQFAGLSAKVRARFENDPAQFLAFASDPKSGPELVALGLAVAAPIPSVAGTPLTEGNKRPKGDPKPPKGTEASE